MPKSRKTLAAQSAKYKKECRDFSQAFTSPVDTFSQLSIDLTSDYKSSPEYKEWYQFWRPESDCSKSTSSLLKAIYQLSESGKLVCDSLQTAASGLDELDGQLAQAQQACPTRGTPVSLELMSRKAQSAER